MIENKPMSLLGNLVFSDFRKKSLFLLVGALNTLITYLSFVLLLQLSVSYITASILSYIAGMINSYILNRNIVFISNRKKSVRKRKSILPFCVVNLVSMISSTTILYVCVNYLELYVYLSQVVAITCSLVINYMGYRAIFN